MNPLIVFAMLAVFGSAAPESPTGSIVGRITDKRCGIPVPFVNVMVSPSGAQTDRNGHFRVDNVLAGAQPMRIFGMGYEAVSDTITVVAGDSVRADFIIKNKGDDTTLSPRPRDETSVCPEHEVRMRWILAATSYGLHVVDPEDNRLFPNAWLYAYEDVHSPPKVFWVQGCPVCSDGWNQKHSNDRWKRLPKSVPGTWEPYHHDGVVDFKAPRGLAATVVEDSCLFFGQWEGDNLWIAVRRVPIWYGRPKGDYNIWDVVGDCKSAICVVEQEEEVHVTASLASTTNAIDDTVIEIKSSGRRALDNARMILASIRFP